ncbi:aminopeptidase P family protein [Paludicola sp. MB14-C6]|uniref:M24 family metallopeptidase n=1 Tax=Paludihabitans sp. MB14-C6 TaxID=3070656 RepID=UPI0027DB5BF5|nr:aminopeptidase P family protein [Paludicola sp. MB14-C6]WMJ23670.1 aminopeptidase P family protein [Paludicola sp. MB14-C6]
MNQSLVTLMNALPEGADAAIITSAENRRYFTNMKSSAGTLVVTSKKAYFIIDFRYIEKAKTVITDFDVILQDNDIFAQIDGILKENEVKTVAIEAGSMTVGQFQKYCDKLPSYHFLNTNGLSNFISDLRSIKSEEEIGFITKAQEITDKAFLHILDYIKPGMTEVEIALELEYTMKKLGASNLAFDSIVVSGTNSSLPHGVPSVKKVENGDFITMDFGAAYNGYCSDMTRTVALGKISDEQKKVYDTVLTSQLMALEAICAGKKYSDIDKVARDYIYSQGYEGCFGHGLGHSLGLFIHEEPRFSSLCDEITKENTIMTVEPGVYLSGKFGVRIEDMVVIKENGCVIITKSEKNLITL